MSKTKKIFLFLCLIGILSLSASMVVFAEEGDIAAIGEKTYSKLADAVDAVEDGETILLLEDAIGSGVKVVSGKNFTIDLNGHTYQVVNPTVGSTGTETNGFQLLKDSNITIKNGKITSDVAKILIQNYSNLTLDGVELEGKSVTQYVLSNNFGNVVLKNGTKITATEENVAFDVYYGMSAAYDEGVIVTIETSDVIINGKVEYGRAKRATEEDMLEKAKIIVADGVELTLADGLMVRGNRVTLLVVPSEIVTDIGEKDFEVGEAVEFTFSTIANDDAGIMVIGSSNFSEEDAIEKLEYFEVKDGNWYELKGDFGPATGFPMADATSRFRVTFQKAGEYSFSAYMKSVKEDMILCQVKVDFVVSEEEKQPEEIEPTYYEIEIIQGNHGTVIPNETIRVEEGKGERISIQANEGYEIADVLVDEKSVGCVTEYVFEEVKENHKIEVKFKKKIAVISIFKDVKKEKWYVDAIEFVAEKGIMKGVAEEEFAPEDCMTRGMMVQMLYNLVGKPEVTSKELFDDVKSDAWYATAIAWAKENEIIKGVGDNLFNPEEEATREQIVIMLYRYAKFMKMDVTPEEKVDLEKYEDAELISEYAKPIFEWAIEKEILKGRTSKHLVPQDFATRAETATIIMRFLENDKK